MHWRQIGPTRGGRARALSGVPSQPNVFYIGFDNGGVWRSTDYGSTWEPHLRRAADRIDRRDRRRAVGSEHHLRRHRRRASSGPTSPIGDGVYKSTDAGKTWTHLGLSRQPDDRDDRRRSRAIRTGSSSPRSAIRTGRTRSAASSDRPTAARRSRRCFTRTSTRAATTCASIRRTRTSSTPRSGSSSRASSKGRGSAAPANGIFKSTDGGTTWKQLTEGLPSVMQANLAHRAEQSADRCTPSSPARRQRRRRDAATTTGVVGFYKTTDGGEHWCLVGPTPPPAAARSAQADPRPLGAHRRRRSADPDRRSEERPNVVYSARSCCGGPRTAA